MLRKRSRLATRLLAGIVGIATLGGVAISSQTAAVGAQLQETPPATQQAGTQYPIYDPVVPSASGEGTADPSVTYSNGYYYYVKIRQNRNIVLYKSKNIYSIAQGTVRNLLSWNSPGDPMAEGTLWAPELQYVKQTGKWYIYFTADNAKGRHKMYVMEGGALPDDPFVYKGMVKGQNDFWQIDGTLVEKAVDTNPANNKLYFVDSYDPKGGSDNTALGIYEMSDPFTFKPDTFKMLSHAEYAWEKMGNLTEQAAGMRNQ